MSDDALLSSESTASPEPTGTQRSNDPSNPNGPSNASSPGRRRFLRAAAGWTAGASLLGAAPGIARSGSTPSNESGLATDAHRPTDLDRAIDPGHWTGSRGSNPSSTQSDDAIQMALNPGRIGVSVSQTEAIELADRFGFDAVTPQVGYLAGLSDAEMAELRDDLERRGLVFSAAGVPVQFRQDRTTFRRDLLNLPDLAKTLARADVSRAGTWIMPTHSEMTYHENFELHVERLRPIARILQDHGVRFGLEYVASPNLYIRDRYPFVHDLAETLELIEAVGHANMGVVLDAWHWHFAGDGRDALLALSPEDVVVADLNDAPAGVPREEQQDGVRRLPTTTGVIDLEGFLTALQEIGFAGPVRAEPFDDSLGEMPVEEAVARTAETMEASLALLDR